MVVIPASDRQLSLRVPSDIGSTRFFPSRQLRAHLWQSAKVKGIAKPIFSLKSSLFDIQNPLFKCPIIVLHFKSLNFAVATDLLQLILSLVFWVSYDPESDSVFSQGAQRCPTVYIGKPLYTVRTQRCSLYSNKKFSGKMMPKSTALSQIPK